VEAGEIDAAAGEETRASDKYLAAVDARYDTLSGERVE
jgi:hypothetical protein